MKLDLKNIIQIAGIIDQKEAKMLLSKGADLLGFVLYGKSRDDSKERDVINIVNNLKIHSSSIIITYLENSEALLSLFERTKITKFQIHGEINKTELIKLKQSNILTIIKSLIIKQDNQEKVINYVNDTQDLIDAYITDTYDPDTGKSGATGKTHNWDISKNIVDISNKPVILAGGLTHVNVYQAIGKVRPAGVDAHTGLENADGKKDEQLVSKFISNARRAFSNS